MTLYLQQTRLIISELRRHAPYTAMGTLTGIAIMLLVIELDIPKSISSTLFWTFHPLHVVLSALVTMGVYRLHAEGKPLYSAVLVGYLGSVGIATLSDSIIPYAGEWLLDLPNRGIHIGFIEKWWLVNPLALLGVVAGYFYPKTTFPHFGHVLLSVWASLFHIIMALGYAITPGMLLYIALFLFLAVWIPCCTSDIVFPLLWVRKPDLSTTV